jgi:hypothetical protein
MNANSWNSYLLALYVEIEAETTFNSVLLNFISDGKDSRLACRYEKKRILG